MNGVIVRAQLSLDEVAGAAAVLIGSGVKTREIVADGAMMARLAVDSSRQLVGAQCSGALVLAAKGLLRGVPACTDLTTRPWLAEAGIEILDRPFHAQGDVATAGGCLAAVYLAAWTIARLAGDDAARAAVHYVAPVGEKDETVRRVMAVIAPHLAAASASPHPLKPGL